MRFGSMASGIEAASVAWESLGWEPEWFSEIEPFPAGLLEHRYPHVVNIGDMRNLPDVLARGELEAPELVCGGTPCQAFSVAGKRASLDDDRGNLTLTFCDVVDVVDEKRKEMGLDPCIVFWENVPGVLWTKDNAFGCFLGKLAGEDGPLEPAGKRWTNAGCVFGPRRTIAWRVLDAQYFGVAQRRRRVFVVASARDGFDPAAVLFERDGVRRDSAPSREAREDAPGRAKDGPGDGRWPALVAPTLNAHFGDKQGLEHQHVFHGCGLFVPDYTNALTSHNGNRNEVSDILNGCVVQLGPVAVCATGDRTHALTTRSAAEEDGTGRGVPITPGNVGVRRLTPRECERLQGFPDDYTAIPWKNKLPEACPDGPRYKALGNSWAVPVVRWIGQRIQKHLNGEI